MCDCPCTTFTTEAWWLPTARFIYWFKGNVHSKTQKIYFYWIFVMSSFTGCWCTFITLACMPLIHQEDIARRVKIMFNRRTHYFYLSHSNEKVLECNTRIPTVVLSYIRDVAWVVSTIVKALVPWSTCTYKEGRKLDKVQDNSLASSIVEVLRIVWLIQNLIIK